MRSDAEIRTIDQLKGKILVLGSREAAESTILPTHFLKHDGVDLSTLKTLSLDGEFDLRGNPCSSEGHVLKALQEGRGQAGIIGERLWNRLSKEQPDQVSGLRVLWISPPFSHCVFTASKDFDRALGERFSKLMLAMNPSAPETAEVMRLEGTSKWIAGSQDGFQALFQALDETEASCCAEASASQPARPR